jgi:hypothetical protein
MKTFVQAFPHTAADGTHHVVVALPSSATYVDDSGHVLPGAMLTPSDARELAILILQSAQSAELENSKKS